jgi:hypothetical protein
MSRIFEKVLKNPIQILLLYILIAELTNLFKTISAILNEKKINSELPESTSTDVDNLIHMDNVQGGKLILKKKLSDLIEELSKSDQNLNNLIPLLTAITLIIENDKGIELATTSTSSLTTKVVPPDSLGSYIIISETVRRQIWNRFWVQVEINMLGNIKIGLDPRWLTVLVRTLAVSVLGTSIALVGVYKISLPRNFLGLGILRFRQHLYSVLIKFANFVKPGTFEPGSSETIFKNEIVADVTREKPLLLGGRVDSETKIVEGEILSKHTFDAPEIIFETMEKHVNPVPVEMPPETSIKITRDVAKKRVPLDQRTTNFIDFVRENPIVTDEVRSRGRENLRNNNN